MQHGELMRFHIRTAVILASAIFLLTAKSTFATITFIGCPAWAHPTSTAYFSDPGMAVTDGLNNSSQVPQSCKPVTGGACTHPANDFTTFNCTDYYNAQCNNGPITGQATGSGFPVAGNQIFKTGDPAVTQCAISYFDPWDPLKNRGDCPSCKGNPINVGTGNKFERETDIAAAEEGGLEFVRVYNSAGPYLSSGMGPQWTHSYSRYLFFRASDRKSVV